MSDLSVFVTVAAASLLGTAWSFVDYSRNVRIAGVAIIAMVFGSLVLSGPAMIAIVGLLTAGVLVVVFAHHQVSSQLTASGVVMLLAVAIVSIVQARRRDALGLHRMSAESVLERVRNRIKVQGSVPDLPLGWHVQVAQTTANRAAFAGDFVSSRAHDVDGVPYLDLALVDVSGSGIDAGSRALLLSGAVGGLLGAVPPDELLPRCNDYLRRQGWIAGFASASYLRVNLATWEYEVRGAGHPPALMWSASSSTTRRSVASGTVLGVVDDLGGSVDSGRLANGDALVIYTDGVVEDRHNDLDTGIRRLEALVGSVLRAGSVEALADRVVADSDTSNEDDRTAVVIWNERAVRSEPRQRFGQVGGRRGRPDVASAGGFGQAVTDAGAVEAMDGV